MTDRSTPSLIRHLWRFSRWQFVAGVTFSGIYAGAGIFLVFFTAAFVHLFFVQVPRVPVVSLVPGALRSIAPFHQTLDRKDLAFSLPLSLVGVSFVFVMSAFVVRVLFDQAARRCVASLAETWSKQLMRHISGGDSTAAAAHAERLSLTLDAHFQALGTAVRTVCCELPLIAFALVGLSLLVPSWLVFVILAISFSYVFFVANLDRRSRRFLRWSHGFLGMWLRRLERLEKSYWSARLLGALSREKEDLQILLDRTAAYWSRVIVLQAWQPALFAFLVPGIVVSLGMSAFLDHRENVDVSGIFVAVVLVIGGASSLRKLVGALPQLRGARKAERQLALSLRDSVWSQASLSTTRAQDLLEFESVSLGNIVKFSARVGPGERVAWVSSGARSVSADLIRVAAGLMNPIHGAVRRISDAGFVSAMPCVFAGTLLENLDVAIRDVPVGIRFEKCLRMISFLGLAYSGPVADVFTTRLIAVGGRNLDSWEKMRISLGRTLLTEPSLLLIEEPSEIVSLAELRDFWDLIERWQKSQSGRSVLASIHAVHDNTLWTGGVVFRDGTMEALPHA